MAASAAQSPPASTFAAPAAPAELQPGDTAVVRGEGDCLRLRDAPSLAGNRITCLADGSTVIVMPGTELADGITWQFVQAGSQLGWVAAEFLSPYEGAACPAEMAASARPGLTGDVPAQGGFGLIVWGGGTAGGIATAASARGCSLRAVWATTAEGSWVGYLVGAPDFVNRAWDDYFGSGRIPAGSPLIAVCGPADSEQSVAARTAGQPLPVPWGDAPAALASTPPPEVSAVAAVVIDEASGAVLYEKNAHEPLVPASLTKIVTAILAIEGGNLGDTVPIDVESLDMRGSSLMGLHRGDCFNVTDLLYGLLLPSGNDAALALGRYVAGSDEAFVQLMNTLVRRLGLSESQFTDAHGLSPATRTSAYDLGMLARYAMQLDAFADIVDAPGWTVNGSRKLTLRNVNQFLTQYEGADGVKTGFTEQAGRTLVASATRDGRRLYAVVLNAQDRFADAEALLDWAFSQHSWE